MKTNMIKKDRKKIAKITLLLNLYSCCVIPQSKPEYLLNDGTLIFKNTDNNYYRGEDNYNYSLLPSIYRNEDLKQKEINIILRLEKITV